MISKYEKKEFHYEPNCGPGGYSVTGAATLTNWYVAYSGSEASHVSTLMSSMDESPYSVFPITPTRSNYKLRQADKKKRKEQKNKFVFRIYSYCKLRFISNWCHIIKNENVFLFKRKNENLFLFERKNKKVFLFKRKFFFFKFKIFHFILFSFHRIKNTRQFQFWILKFNSNWSFLWKKNQLSTRQSPEVETGAFPWRIGGGKFCLRFFCWMRVWPIRLATVSTQGLCLVLILWLFGCNETFPHTCSEGAVTMSLNLTAFQKLSWSPWRVKTGELAASADDISTRTDPIPSPIMCVKNETHTAGTETGAYQFQTNYISTITR